MSFWQTVKNSAARGFGYGFGGRIGWELGGFVWGLVRKVGGFLLLGLVGLMSQKALVHHQPTAQVQDKPAVVKQVKHHHQRVVPPERQGQN